MEPAGGILGVVGFHRFSESRFAGRHGRHRIADLPPWNLHPPADPMSSCRAGLGFFRTRPTQGFAFGSPWATYMPPRKAGLRMPPLPHFSAHPGQCTSSPVRRGSGCPGFAAPAAGGHLWRRLGRGGAGVAFAYGLGPRTLNLELGTVNRSFGAVGQPGTVVLLTSRFPGALPKSKIENRKSKMFAGSRFPGNLETTLNVAPPYLGKTSAPERLRCRSVLQTRGILCRSIRVRLEAST